ncbi:MAG TPA: hypothetical protein VGM76_08085 [Lacipirellulaceae bacterium]|jgi:hypothetical protein
MATAIAPQTSKLPFETLPLWHKSAPRPLVEKFASGDADQAWAAWQKHLARRKSLPAPRFLDGKRPPLLWCWPVAWERDGVLLQGRPLAQLCKELSGDAVRGDELPQALQALAIAYALPKLASKLSPHVWWDLAEALCDLAREAQQLCADPHGDVQEVLRQQLLAGELPLALTYLFPELQPTRDLQPLARQLLSESLATLLDGKGGPHARLLPVLGPLIACWTRARWLGKRLKRGSWSTEAEAQYQWLIRSALRLAAPDGRFLATNTRATRDEFGFWPMLARAIDLAGDKADCAAAATLSPAIAAKKTEAKCGNLPKPAFHSEWAALATLATGWSKSDARLAIAYARDPLALELQVGGRQLLAGTWTSETICNGEPVAVAGSWDELCWQSDQDCDYLELSIDLANNLRLDRQILLAKRDAVLFLIDVLQSTGGAARSLRHSFHLPWGRDVTWQPEAETRDGLLVDRKPRAAVLPLALSEWRSDPRGGSLVGHEGHLTLTQEATGRALYCPLLFDLKPGRAKQDRTWRQLTVAESLSVVPRDVAVGFRAHSGDDQWVVYRSLGPAANRTVLGQNISGEFAAGRFPAAGEIKAWIETEVSETEVG